MGGVTAEPAHANKEAVRAHFDAKLRLDGAFLAAQMTDDVEWWSPRSTDRLGMARPLVGNGAIVSMLTSVPLYVPESRRWVIHHLVAEDDVVIAHARMSATTRSGSPYDNEYVFVFRFRDGLIDAIWEHLDTAYAYERIGATKVGPVTER
jgi:ketosteroid isomerase-like protein